MVLRRIKEYRRSLDLTVVAYCLLPNHYHLLVRQDGDNAAGLLPQRVFDAYSKAYNARYGHSGTPFQGPHRALAVEDESYLLQLSRYIHANPVVHGLVAEASAWPYANYLEWIGEREGTLVDQGLVRAYFPRPDRYRDYVTEYLVEHRPPEALWAHVQRLEG